MLKRNFFVITRLAGTGVALLTIFIVGRTVFKGRPSESPRLWNQEAIKATYVASQLRETDNAHSTMILSYDLQNNTDSDYRLEAGPEIHILSKLVADGSLSQQEPLQLSYPVFLPAKQHARLSIEITQPFVWPVEQDAAYVDKLREFVKQRLVNVGEFVLFDQTGRIEIQLPGAWQELQEAARASY